MEFDYAFGDDILSSDDINIIIPEEDREFDDESLYNEPDVVVEKKHKRVAKNYINNGDFCNAVIEYTKNCDIAKEEGKPKPILPDYIALCFADLAENISRRYNFSRYQFRDDMVADGIENCIRYVTNFDPTQSTNAFGYYSKVIWWCFLRKIRREKKEQYVKYKSTELYGQLDLGDVASMSNGNALPIEIYDNMYEFIRKFEEVEFKKVEKQISKKKTAIVGIELFLED
jgi:hypothetical protein